MRTIVCCVALALFVCPSFADPIGDFVVYGGGSNVNITNATVNGVVGVGASPTGNLLENINSTTGGMRAGRLVTVSAGSTVNGDVLTTLITNQGTITGTVTFGPFSGATVPTTVFSSSGSGGNQFNPGALLPGDYGLVIVNGGSLTLTAGDYFFTGLNLNNGTVTLDASGGAIRIFVDNTFLGSSNLATPTLIGSAADIRTEVAGNTSIGFDWYGTLIGHGQINLFANPGFKTHDGVVWGKGNVFVRGYNVNGLPASVPEPGALALMLGAAAFVWRRRR